MNCEQTHRQTGRRSHLSLIVAIPFLLFSFSPVGYGSGTEYTVSAAAKNAQGGQFELQANLKTFLPGGKAPSHFSGRAVYEKPAANVLPGAANNMQTLAIHDGYVLLGSMVFYQPQDKDGIVTASVHMSLINLKSGNIEKQASLMIPLNGEKAVLAINGADH